MNFRVLEQRGLENARSPFRVVEDSGQEVEWVNRFLDQERVRSVAETTLRSYAYDLLNFLRWWVEVSQTTAINEKAESTLLDYIRFQTNRQPPPAAATINRRVGIAERALRLAFPHAQTSFVPGFQYGYWRPLPLGIGRPLPALSRLRVRTPKRVILPLTVEEVDQFWASFRTSRDLAIVVSCSSTVCARAKCARSTATIWCSPNHSCACAARAANRAAYRWLRKPCNCWIIICFWNARRIAARPYSSVSKGVLAESD